MRFTRSFALTLVVTVLLGALVAPQSAAAQSDSQPTPTEATYLAATKPFRDRLADDQVRLDSLLQAASEGKIDDVALDDLGTLSRELFAARQAFGDAVPSVRLDQYDRTIKLALDRAYASTVLLLHAQVTESAPDSDAQIRDATIQGKSAGKLFKEATDELRAQIPATAL